MKKKIYLLVVWLAIVVSARGQRPSNDGSWNIVFEEEWNYDSINGPDFKTNWNLDFGWGKTTSDKSLHAAVDDNASLSNGKLILRLEYDPGVYKDSYDFSTGIWSYKYFPYTSGHVSSKQSFLYGYFESTLKPPAGEGLHGAFWLIGGGCDPITGRYYDEIDVFEPFGATAFPVLSTNVHFETNANCQDYARDEMFQEFSQYTSLHLSFLKYAVEWAPNYIIWWLNSEPVRVLWSPKGGPIPIHPMYIQEGPGISLNFGSYQQFQDQGDLPVEWRNESIKHWSADIRENTLIYTGNTDFASYTSDPYVAKTINLNASSNLTIDTSNKVTLRASDNVTLTKNITINPNGSGHFNILVPDYN